MIAEGNTHLCGVRLPVDVRHGAVRESCRRQELDPPMVEIEPALPPIPLTVGSGSHWEMTGVPVGD